MCTRLHTYARTHTHTRTHRHGSSPAQGCPWAYLTAWLRPGVLTGAHWHFLWGRGGVSAVPRGVHLTLREQTSLSGALSLPSGMLSGEPSTGGHGSGRGPQDPLLARLLPLTEHTVTSGFLAPLAKRHLRAPPPSGTGIFTAVLVCNVIVGNHRAPGV